MFRRDIDRPDIQAFAYTAFGSLTGAVYVLLRVVDAPAARRFLGALSLATVADLEPATLVEATQCAITAAGLRALGLTDAVVQRFDPEFVEGMAGDPNRSLRLGDTGANAPERWAWGAGEREPHVVVMLFAAPARLGDLERATREAAEHSGLAVIASLPTTDMGDVEPFGFADGVSQPTFDWRQARTPGTKADRAFTNRIALGEILLGYYNEYGFPADSPKLAPGEANAALLVPAAGAAREHDLGRNGSYLVFRQLAQDVRGFWRWIAEDAARAGADPQALAEAMVGRRMNGEPLPDFETGLDLPGVDPADRGVNGFLFDADPDGLSCPIGAHVRRANPRTGDAPPGARGAIDNLLATLGLTTRRQRDPTSSTLPWEKNTTVWPYLRHEDDAIASARFHRILRRGREYGTKIDRAAALDPSTPDPEAGLQFICLNANIARQFEFVQGAWLATAKFAGLTGEQDPLVGNRAPFPAPPLSETPQRTDSFSRPGAEPCFRRATAMPQFVTVKGGAYFFMPGLAALKWIASL
ncbi:Dyp-type peroxidase [Roseiarcus sp.]|uniref:Dyp-type peroxidase n=1 Tax=Roseiarcus sp. TaxID=1969460 RepID=UPI003F97C8A8